MRAVKWFVALALAALALPVLAEDWEGTVTVKYNDEVMFVSVQKYVGMTGPQVIDLNARAQAVLDHASRNQDRGGPYTVVWEEKGKPAVETPGLTSAALVSVVRKMNQWNTKTIDHMEARRQKGQKKLWGK